MKRSAWWTLFIASLLGIVVGVSGGVYGAKDYAQLSTTLDDEMTARALSNYAITEANHADIARARVAVAWAVERIRDTGRLYPESRAVRNALYAAYLHLGAAEAREGNSQAAHEAFALARANGYPRIANYDDAHMLLVQQQYDVAWDDVTGYLHSNVRQRVKDFNAAHPGLDELTAAPMHK